MGFLSVQGNVLTYNQYKDKVETYKKHGLAQLVSIFKAHKDRHIPLDQLKWGDEVEYQLYQISDSDGLIKLSNRGPELIQIFNQSKQSLKKEIYLQPEFGSWMIEAIPMFPYQSLEAKELLSSHESLSLRRKILNKFCKQYDLQILSMTNVISMGVPGHIDVEKKDNEASKSIFVWDQAINNHPRFAGLVKSIRERRGSKVDIRIPIFQDTNTNMTEANDEEPYPGFIYMDAMHFGMGQCCLQLTYECQTINHARYLHDMLLPFTGIMAALSAAGPIHKGKISDYDMRWTVIEQSVDCRTQEERANNHPPKSRYSSMNHYISNNQLVKDELFDSPPLNFDKSHRDSLIKDGFDERLANHFASLFIRDPIPSYEGEFMEEHIDDTQMVSHFENLQSTNWNSLRFKPPPSQDSKIGWRVEFRTLDIQLTDFENSCLIVLMGLLTNIINYYDVNFTIPISLSDENMETAHKRDALLKEKFWVNVNCISSTEGLSEELHKYDYLTSNNNLPPKYEKLSISELFIGTPSFQGLFPLFYEFIQLKMPSEKDRLMEVLNFLQARVRGEIPTGARFLRDFIQTHSDYQRDSIVRTSTQRDLISMVQALNTPECKCEMGTDSGSHDSEYYKEIENDERSKLLGKWAKMMLV